MDTQVLENLKPVSSAKRAATGSDAEGSSIVHNKRARRHPHDNATDSFALHNSDSDTDLDDIFLDPSVDPKTLCPWCDERLPSNPTPHLVSLMDVARRRSYADDRPTNPLGLRAPPAVFVSVCQRHRFERIWVPRARKRGWPTRIDWGRLSGRVGHLEGTLKTLVDDIDEDLSTFALKLDIKGKGKGQHPRRTNEFWQEVVKNVREQGSRQATGVRGQFLHFNKTQPGYYGELGYVIIHQTLCNLFPPASFDPAAAQPLTPEEFIAHILVPEAAANLIMEDLGLSRVDALKTLRESVEYGVAMFPADEGEGGRVDGDTSILTAGERMIMERARARRKELEEEERMEEEQERRAHGLAPQTDTEPEVDVDIDHAPPSSSMTRKPKPRPVPKRKPPSSDNPPRASVPRSRSTSRTLESDGGVIDLSSDTGGSTGASRIGIAKRQRKAPEGPPSSRSDAPTDTGATTPRPKPKPRPKPRPRAIVRTASQSDSHNGVPSSDPQLPDEDEELLPLPSKPVRSATRGTERTDTLLGSTSRPKPRSPTRTTTGHSSPPDVSGSRLSRGGTKLGSCLPLQLARERRQERGSADGLDLAAKTHDKVKGKQSEGWLPNLRANGAEEFSTDEEDQSQPGPLPKAIAVRRTASRPSNGRNADQWDWLLSDGSSAGSRTSSFAN
ncbi:RTC4-like domain-containing protein [Trametes gibbosa]|nr:RTC4-like domain-containing protein [Trametes gibbosa]